MRADNLTQIYEDTTEGDEEDTKAVYRCEGCGEVIDNELSLISYHGTLAHATLRYDAGRDPFPCGPVNKIGPSSPLNIPQKMLDSTKEVYSLAMNGTEVLTDEACDLMWEGLFKTGPIYLGFHSGPPSAENEFQYKKRIEISRQSVGIKDGKLHFLYLPVFKDLPPMTYGGFWTEKDSGELLFTINLT